MKFKSEYVNFLMNIPQNKIFMGILYMYISLDLKHLFKKF
jgi:hypothetical protein